MFFIFLRNNGARLKCLSYDRKLTWHFFPFTFFDTTLLLTFKTLTGCSDIHSKETSEPGGRPDYEKAGYCITFTFQIRHTQ